MSKLVNIFIYHCGPLPAARRVTVSDAVLSAPHCHLLRETIHPLHNNTQQKHSDTGPDQLNLTK